MRTVNFRDDVVYPIAHLLGLDPTSVDFQNEHARKMVAALNSNVRYGWEFWQWPELNLTEERAFRRVWYADEQYVRSNADSAPDELYYIPNSTYYRVKASAVSDPAIGTLPTDTTYFDAIDATALDKYVAYDQPGKRAIGRVFSIYNTSPRLTVPALGWSHRPSELGIDVSWIAGPTVWLKYQVRPSLFSATPWDANTAYAAGQTVYDPASGNCYRARVANTNVAVTVTATWALQEFPYALSEYATQATAADVADDAQQASIWRAQAREFLYREIDKLFEQGQRYFYDISGGRCNRVPLGLSGFWWSVAAPDTWPIWA